MGLSDDWASVVVTPLSPPFRQNIMRFSFEGIDTQLAVSLADGRRIKALLGDAPIDRVVVLEPVEGNSLNIRISVVQ
jgi:hypothetical protein